MKIAQLIILMGLATLPQFALAKQSKCQTIASQIKESLWLLVDETSCGWNHEFALKSFEQGLSKVCEVNPTLLKSFAARPTNRLIVICDLEAIGRKYPFYSSGESAIHLRKNAAKDAKTQGALFHEFLHFMEIPFDEEFHNDEASASELDPVYACHVTGYPEFAEKILGSISKLSIAQKTCSEVTLN